MSEMDRRAEKAAGGLVGRTGDIVQMGNGEQWWLNDAQWARNEADALIVHDRRLNRMRNTDGR